MNSSDSARRSGAVDAPSSTAAPRWNYRPHEHDDWGTVKDARGFMVAKARYDKPGISEDELNEHRRNKTDPCERTGRLIAAAPRMLAALRRLLPDDIDSNPEAFMADWHEARAAVAEAEGTADLSGGEALVPRPLTNTPSDQSLTSPDLAGGKR